jgi:guanylate cyclase
MYGILLKSIQQSIVERYGEAKWQAVLATAIALDNRSIRAASDVADDEGGIMRFVSFRPGEPIIFHVHQQYPENLMPRIAVACAQVLQQLVPLGRHITDKGGNWPAATSDEFLRSFGHCFVGYTTRLGFDRVMGSLGRYFRDFLANIDNLHETMRFTYRRMVSPSFYVTDENEHGCTLHYRSVFVTVRVYFISTH